MTERLTTTVAAWCVTTALVISSFSVQGCGTSDSGSESSVETPEVTQAPAAIADTLSSGESLYTSLVSSGLEASDVVDVLDVLGKEVNLRSCKPGDSYTADLGSDGFIASLCYKKGMTQLFMVHRDSTGYTVAKDEIPIVVVTRRIEGVLESSLWEAFTGIGEDPQIALKLADVLGWEIDFVTDPRVGDTFIMIFEELYCEDRKIGIGDVIGAGYLNEDDEHLAFGYPDEDGRMQHYDYEGNSVKRVFLKSPLNYRRISSYFTNRRFHPILKRYRAHHGVDYAAPTGTPVVSIGDGRVVSAGWNGGMGNFVEIRHNHVYSSCYGHLSRYGKGVRKGTRVKQGQVVGYVGSTGLSTGPHLDFRVKRYGSYVNPLTIDYPRGEPIGEDLREAYFAARDVVLKGLRYRQVAAASSTGSGS
ncbi:MAG: peptidoglycan DD-metalloendopeptidase family protein [Candidatus Eisenbacteria bacterium]